jgi:hypothetical protein
MYPADRQRRPGGLPALNHSAASASDFSLSGKRFKDGAPNADPPVQSHDG